MYLVRLQCNRFWLMEDDGTREEWGFFRNAYALAWSAEAAIEKAKYKTYKDLHVCYPGSDRGIPLKAKEVYSCSFTELPRLWRREPFIFYELHPDDDG